MTTQKDDLDRLLAEAPDLDDRGFTAGVMRRLAEPAVTRPGRRALLLAASLCAALVAAAMLPATPAAIAAVRGLIEPLLALPLDPARAAAALKAAGPSALAVHGTVLVMVVWGALGLARGDSP